jgi:hypothetical protein
LLVVILRLHDYDIADWLLLCCCRASQSGDGSAYKPRPSAVPSAALPLSPSSGRPGATGYPGYTGAAAREASAAALRYVQQSPYGGAVPYRESPYTLPRNPVSHMANCLAAQLYEIT